MAHPLEATIREAYAAFGRGDIEGYLKPCTEGFMVIVPGRGRISGTYQGKQDYMNSRGRLWRLRMEPFPKKLKMCWRTMNMQSFSRGIISHVRAPRRITGLRTSMMFAKVNSFNALNSLAIRQVSTTPGAPRKVDSFISLHQTKRLIRRRRGSALQSLNGSFAGLAQSFRKRNFRGTRMVSWSGH
jgi:hypothetical protein